MKAWAENHTSENDDMHPYFFSAVENAFHPNKRADRFPRAFASQSHVTLPDGTVLQRTHDFSIFTTMYHRDVMVDAVRHFSPGTQATAWTCLTMFELAWNIDDEHIGKAKIYCERALNALPLRVRAVCAVTDLLSVSLVWMDQYAPLRHTRVRTHARPLALSLLSQ